MEKKEKSDFSNEKKFLNKKKILKLNKEVNSSEKSFFNGRWTEEEHNLFIDNIIFYGNDWKKVKK